MDRTQNERLREAFNYLKGKRKVRNQQDFTERIDSDRTTVSLVLNGKIKIPDILFVKVTEAFPELSRNWLISGKGEMLIPSINQENKNGPNVIGDNNFSDSTNKELLEMLKKKDEQMDRLITLLEQMSKK